MRLTFSKEDELFREEVRSWLDKNLSGKFLKIKYRGGPGDENAFIDERKEWETVLADGGWTCIGWPVDFGGRGASIERQVIFHEEYARAGGPGRMGHIGETLLGPTLYEFGTTDQCQRFLPGILRGHVFWCQGYSEPNAGSDLANIKTKANFDKPSGRWLITGQKVWTSLAHESDFCFVLARTNPDSSLHKGLGFFLVKLHQPGIEIRPIRQMTATSEFNEIFFNEAVCSENDVVGSPEEGWKVAMGLLGFERGISTLGQQMLFQNEFDAIVTLAKKNGSAKIPEIRARIADAYIGLKIMRYNIMRVLSGFSDAGELQPAALISKLYWSTWHRNLGKLAMDVLGPEGELLLDSSHKLGKLQSLFLFTRADTIYGGTNQIQRNIIAERALKMPREPRG